VALEFAGDAIAAARILDAPVDETSLSSEQRGAVEIVRAYLKDGRTDLSVIPVDLALVSAFDREVLTELRKVRPGQTVSYGDLARRLGRPPGASRAIGGAMGRNPIPVVLPCHRVVQADGALGHYSGLGGVATKLRFLQLEGSRW
jgi:methylated-DNA-[protein]-cysteine S-methyltransferase